MSAGDMFGMNHKREDAPPKYSAEDGSGFTLPTGFRETGLIDDGSAFELPRGFEERCTQFLGFEASVLNSFYNNILLRNWDVVRLPAVGRAATFERGAQTTGDKTFPLYDRKGRNLMLTPDGMALLMRWYVKRVPDLSATDVGWISPIFRYRKDGNRQFTQFGYAAFNYDHEKSPLIVAPKLEELVSTLLRTVSHDLKVPVKLVITNPGVWKELIKTQTSLPEQSAIDLLNALRPLNTSARLEIVSSLFPNATLTSFIKDISSLVLSGSGSDTSPDCSRGGAFVGPLVQFGKRMGERFHLQWEIDLGDLHSSEILDGPCVRFMAGGRSLGDGGTYHGYSMRFDRTIRSYYSVCAGIEGLATASGVANGALRAGAFFVVFSFPDCLAYSNSLVDRLRDAGIPTTLIEIRKSLKTLLKKHASAHFGAVIGQNELAESAISLKAFKSGSTENVRLADLEDNLRSKFDVYSR
jgi:histidyl-tRNA synthetase